MGGWQLLRFAVTCARYVRRGLIPRHEVPDILTAQLDALAASESDVEGADAWVMAPMVATAEEAAWFVERACRAGLGTAGVMVEVPPSCCAPPTSLAKSTSSA